MNCEQLQGLPTGGTVRVSGRDITYLPSEKRDIGMVFQKYALFLHITIFENVAFPLGIRGRGQQDISRQVGEALELVGLPQLGRRYPAVSNSASRSRARSSSGRAYC